MTVLGWKVFEAINPVHAARLSCCDISQESTTSLRKVQTNLGEDNLYDARGKKTRYIHSQEGAYNEAREWVVHALKDLEEKTEVLVIYGVGLGCIKRNCNAASSTTHCIQCKCNYTDEGNHPLH